MIVYKVVRITRPDSLDPSRIDEYHRCLRQVVFPLVDQLEATGLIAGYDFLTHQHIDLRLWILDSERVGAVRDILEQRGLPSDLSDFAPAETGAERDRLLAILNHSAKQVRRIVEDATGLRTHAELVHWQLNQFGLTNLGEAEFHARQAATWMTQLSRQEGPPSPEESE